MTAVYKGMSRTELDAAYNNSLAVKNSAARIFIKMPNRHRARYFFFIVRARAHARINRVAKRASIRCILQS